MELKNRVKWTEPRRPILFHLIASKECKQSGRQLFVVLVQIFLDRLFGDVLIACAELKAALPVASTTDRA